MVRSLAFAVVATVLSFACSSSDSGAPGPSEGNPDAGSTSDDSGTSEAASPDGGDASAAQDTGKETGPGGAVTPPLGKASNGTGGAAPVGGDVKQASGVTYRLVVPASYAPSQATPFLVVYSGTEGGDQMTQNLMAMASFVGIDGFICAVLDGVDYRDNANAGATVMDDVRAKYDVDNDRTYLLGESAGTTAALSLGFHVRQSYFAAYWANDVIASDTPGQTALELGFAPHGQAGPGGDLPDAQAIVQGMKAAGYRVDQPAPYDGPGSTTHGDQNQFIAAVRWFVGKTRQ
jgi:hypothetical protein